MQEKLLLDSLKPMILKYSTYSPTGLEALHMFGAQLKMDLARTKFRHFVSMVMPEYKWSIHNQMMAIALQMVFDGKIRFLMIRMPPRHGKTEMCSKLFPSFFLGNRPNKNVVLASYSSQLAILNSRAVRDRIEFDQIYRELFPDVKLHEDKSAEREWETTRGGGLRAVGVGSGLTGFGADLMVIDDPYKDFEEANSDVVRAGILDWYDSVARTRLQPGGKGAVMFPYTSWHEQDMGQELIKRALENEFADIWYELRLPALAEEDDPLGRAPGEALWEEMYSARELQSIKAASPRHFSALFQQNPRSEESQMFRREWFKLLDEKPDLDWQEARSWDLAMTDKERSDWTVGTRAYFRPIDLEEWEPLKKLGFATRPVEMVVTDVQRFRAEWHLARKLIYERAVMDGKQVTIVLEDGGLNLAPVQEMKRDLQAAGYRVSPYHPKKTDKIARARNLGVAVESGRVAVVKKGIPAGWLDRFENFPQVEHDDEIDSLSQLYNWAAAPGFRIAAG